MTVISGSLHKQIQCELYILPTNLHRHVCKYINTETVTQIKQMTFSVTLLFLFYFPESKWIHFVVVVMKWFNTENIKHENLLNRWWWWWWYSFNWLAVYNSLTASLIASTFSNNVFHCSGDNEMPFLPGFISPSFS